MSNNSSDYVLSGILGAAGFVVSFLLTAIALQIVLTVSIVISIVIAIACFAAGGFIFTMKAPAEEAKDDVVTKTLKVARERYDLLKSYAKNIPDKKIKENLFSFLETLEKIFVEVKQDPDDMSRARNFLNNNLESIVKIVESYYKISNSGLPQSAFQEKTTRFRSTVDKLNNAAERQLIALLDNDFIDLEAELSVLDSGMENI